MTIAGEPTAVEALRRWCEEHLSESHVRQLEVDPAWGDSWRSHAMAWRAGRVTIRPEWVQFGASRLPGGPAGGSAVDRPADGSAVDSSVEVVVDPSATFGSGSHPTTRMCAEILGEVVRGGETVLDVGVGSGVLAVTALVLGAASAEGTDIDPAARAESTRCAELNGVAGRYRFIGAGLPDPTRDYDLVVANLLIGTIEELGSRLAGLVAPGELLVVSGVLDSQRDRALAAVGAAAADVRVDLSLGGWTAFALRPPAPE